jgi:hypothetical protein
MNPIILLFLGDLGLIVLLLYKVRHKVFQIIDEMLEIEYMEDVE